MAHFAPLGPSTLQWQPSEMDASLHESIQSRVGDMGNVNAPARLDVCETPWKFGDAALDVIYNSNMIHISPWKTTLVRPPPMPTAPAPATPARDDPSSSRTPSI